MTKPVTAIPIISEKKINYFQAAKDYYNKKKKKYFGKKNKEIKIKLNENGLLGGSARAAAARDKALKDAGDY